MQELLSIDPLALFAIILWTLIWKGWALWLAARRGSRNWFIVLLILNTLAILDIIYIFLVAKRNSEQVVAVQDEREVVEHEEKE